MQRKLYFNTIDFLMRAIEAKEAEISSADYEANLPRLEMQMLNLQKRLNIEFRYLADFAGGGNQPL